MPEETAWKTISQSGVTTQSTSDTMYYYIKIGEDGQQWCVPYGAPVEMAEPEECDMAESKRRSVYEVYIVDPKTGRILVDGKGIVALDYDRAKVKALLELEDIDISDVDALDLNVREVFRLREVDDD